MKALKLSVSLKALVVGTEREVSVKEYETITFFQCFLMPVLQVVEVEGGGRVEKGSGWMVGSRFLSSRCFGFIVIHV